MPLDPSIILSGRAPQIDSPLDNMGKILNLKTLVNQSNLQEQAQSDRLAMKNAYAKNLVPGKDGAPVLNQNAVLTDLASNGMGDHVPEIQAQFAESDLKKAAAKTAQEKEFTQRKIQELSQVSDQSGWDNLLNKARSEGWPNVDKVPRQFDPSVKNSMIMRLLPYHDQLAEKHQQFNEQAKLDDQALKKNENASRRIDALAKKGDVDLATIDKLGKELKNDLGADAGRAGNFGKVSEKVLSAQRLQTLIRTYKNGNMPGPQMEELALGLQNMLSPGGGGSRGQVEALVPHTLFGNMQDAKTFLLNEPYGRGQTEFVNKMAETIDREENLANEQLNQIRAQRLPAHGRLKKMSPETYDAILKGARFNPANVKDGVYVSPTKQDAKPATVIQNGHTYNLNPSTGEYE